jgi:hypothetical protein
MDSTDQSDTVKHDEYDANSSRRRHDVVGEQTDQGTLAAVATSAVVSKIIDLHLYPSLFPVFCEIGFLCTLHSTALLTAH